MRLHLTIDNLSFEQEALGLNAMVRLLRRKGMLITAVSGAAWVLAVLLFSLTLFTATLGWWGGIETRIAGWVTVVVFIFAAVFIGLLRPVRRLRQRDAVLIRIGQAYPQMASDVRSAGQLAQLPSHPFSPILIGAEVRMIRIFLESIHPSDRVFPKRNLIPPLVAVLAAIGFLSAAFVYIPEIIESGSYSMFVDQRPPARSLRVSEKAPVVADLSIVLRFPEYLKREGKKMDNISGGFSAPLGTSVTIGGHSLVESATQGEIHLPDGSRMPLSLREDGEIGGSFVVSGPGSFFISLGTEHLMVDGPVGNIEVEPDNPPSIRLLKPSGRVEIGEDAELKLDLEAEDDHGISHIDLVIKGGSDLEIRKTVIRLTDQIRRFKTEYRWSPSGIRLDKDVELEIALEAFDDDTILGPKPGRSDSIGVRILTPLSRHKSALEEQSSALDGLIDLLAVRLETPVPDDDRITESNDRYAQLRGRTEDLLAKAAKLIGLLSKDSLTPKRVVDTFVQIRQDLSNQLLFESRLYEAGTDGNWKDRLSVDKVTARLLERSVVRVDDLIIEQQMSHIEKAGGGLESSRSQLFESLSRYLENRSEFSRRELLSAIDQMEREMMELEKNIEQIRGKVGDVYMNPSSLLKLDLIGSLAELRKLLAADNLDAALKLVKNMENDLGRLLAGLEKGLLSFRTDRFGEGDRFIGDLLDRVMAVESDQIQLRRETVALKRNILDRLSDMMKGKIDPLVKREIGRLDKMQKLAAEAHLIKSAADSNLAESLNNAFRELRLVLNQGDLDEVRRLAEEVLELLMERAPRDAKKKPAFFALRAEVDRVTAEIDAAFPKPAQLLNSKDSHHAENQAVSQRLILAKARRLKEWIQKQSDETRFLSSRALDFLSETVERMSQSAAELELRQVGRALEEQSFALDALAELREDLKQGSETQAIESRPLVQTDKIDLPGPEEFEVPPEFRDDILEAMRGDLPHLYEEPIKKYYETLVQ
jgi:hypothetical protein